MATPFDWSQFPVDPTERAHWQRCGRYLPPLAAVALAQPPSSPSSIWDGAIATITNFPWQSWGSSLRKIGTYGVVTIAISGAMGLTLAQLLSLEAQAQSFQTAAASTTEELTDPQPLDLAPDSLSQLFQPIIAPPWETLEAMLNTLRMQGQRVYQAATDSEEAIAAPEAEPTGNGDYASILAMMREGADRRGEDMTQADLFAAAFENANLFEGEFRGANLFASTLASANAFASGLQGANLYATNLDEINLYGSDLREANLFKADLSGANLYRADLTGANLFGATVTGANLFEANLLGANVRNTDLDAAFFCNTTMPDGTVSNRDCPN